MSDQRVAQPYAKTLIESAKETGKIDAVIKDIKTIKEAFENRDLNLIYKSPIVNASKKKSIIKSIFKGKIDGLSLNFLYLILKKNREPLLGEIIKAADGYVLEIQEITEVVITTATEVTEETLKMIKDKVKSLGQTRTHLDVTHRIDKNLLGGFKVEFEDKVIDASVAHKLKELRRSFN